MFESSCFDFCPSVMKAALSDILESLEDVLVCDEPKYEEGEPLMISLLGSPKMDRFFFIIKFPRLLITFSSARPFCCNFRPLILLSEDGSGVFEPKGELPHHL